MAGQHVGAGHRVEAEPEDHRRRRVGGEQHVVVAAAVEPGAVAGQEQPRGDGDPEAARVAAPVGEEPERAEQQRDADRLEQVVGEEPDVLVRRDRVLTGQLHGVRGVPAAGGVVEPQRHPTQHAPDRRRVHGGQVPVPLPEEREHGDDRQERRLLGEERGGEHQPGHERAAAGRGAPDEEQPHQHQGEEQRIDPGQVQPGAADPVAGGEQPDRDDAGPPVAGLDPHQSVQGDEGDDRGDDRDHPQRREMQPEQPGRSGRHVVVERRVEERGEPDRGRDVQRLAVQDPLHVLEDSAFHPFELERVAEPGERDREVAGDERDRDDEQRRPQHDRAARLPSRRGESYRGGGAGRVEGRA